MLENERLLAALLLAPTVLLLGVFIAYPFVMGVWLALSDTSVGNPGHFVGAKNFIKAFNDSIFRTAFWNTVWYTAWATMFKLALGMWLALLLNRNFRGKRLVRASMLLPFIVPTVLSTFAWRWMFDPTFSVLNWLLYRGGFITTKLPFLSDGAYGMWCAIAVNTWRGMPFFAITLLAGLQTINPDLHEAASLDGANGWNRFWNVTWPLLKPVTLVVVVFSVIQTFSDFQLIYVLTGGGPAELHAPDRHLRLPDRRGHRPPGRGRRHLALHAPGPLHRGLGPAPLSPPPGERLVSNTNCCPVKPSREPRQLLSREPPNCRRASHATAVGRVAAPHSPNGATTL